MRRISINEANVVRWLLEFAPAPNERSKANSSLMSSVNELQVVAVCECGCPSVDFTKDGRTGFRIIAEAVGKSSESQFVELILWGNEQRVSALEVVAYSEDPKAKASLPGVETLKTWEQAGESLKDSRDRPT